MEINQGAKGRTKRSCYKGSTHQRGDHSGVLSRIILVTRDGLEYAKQWKFQVSNSVLQGAPVWEVEASSSEEKVQILERPAAKARPTPKASEPFDRSASSAQRASSSSSSSSVVPQAKPCPSSESRVPKAKSRPSIVDHNSQGHVQSQLRRQSRES